VHGQHGDAGLASAMCATRGRLRVSGDQPVRVLSVTGTWTAATTAARMRPTSGSSRSSAEPAAILQTFLAGQPRLMSMSCAPWSTLARAASAIQAGSAPAICTAMGAGLAAMVGALAALARVPQRRVGREHLGDREARAEAPTEGAEGPVGDAGHGRQDQAVRNRHRVASRADDHGRQRPLRRSPGWPWLPGTIVVFG
jgi:hypothetical protein